MKPQFLSPAFYNAIEPICNSLENDNTKAILAKVKWEREAERCYDALVSYFEGFNLKTLERYGIQKIGVIDLCWNEYGGDIEVDFMPENDPETAFNGGCMMNSSAIDNEGFFQHYFNVSGEDSFEKIDRDYTEVIRIFYLITAEIIESVVKTQSFKKLPLKKPCHIAFGFFHDEERDVIYSVDNGKT